MARILGPFAPHTQARPCTHMAHEGQPFGLRALVRKRWPLAKLAEIKGLGFKTLRVLKRLARRVWWRALFRPIFPQITEMI